MQSHRCFPLSFDTRDERMSKDRDPNESEHARRKTEAETRRAAEPDPIDEAVDESFPASDPPSWSPSHSGTPTDEDEPRKH